MGTVFSSFLNQSFRIPAPSLTEKNLPDQHGKVFIVTGANIGVGYQLASILYRANGTVYVAARTESKARSAMSELKALHPQSTGTLHYLHLDLADLSSIKASADEFSSRESRLDVLWNNAGVMQPPPNSLGAQGHDLTYTTNILGPFLFTKLLLPILRSTAVQCSPGAVRVCWASSVAVYVSSPPRGGEFDAEGTLHDYEKKGANETYGVSKSANNFLAHEFGRRFGDKDGVLHSSFNPGNLKTALTRHTEAVWGAVAMGILGYLLYPPVFGAYTELYAGLSPELNMQDQGVFIAPWGRKAVARKDIVEEFRVDGNSEKMYEWCERETAKYG